MLNGNLEFTTSEAGKVVPKKEWQAVWERALDYRWVVCRKQRPGTDAPSPSSSDSWDGELMTMELGA